MGYISCGVIFVSYLIEVRKCGLEVALMVILGGLEQKCLVGVFGPFCLKSECKRVEGARTIAIHDLIERKWVHRPWRRIQSPDIRPVRFERKVFAHVVSERPSVCVVASMIGEAVDRKANRRAELRCCRRYACRSSAALQPFQGEPPKS